jgi:hypothetical protein
MKGLANVARRVAFMLVEEISAGHKVDKRKPSQQRQRPSRRNLAEYVFCQTHATFSLHSTVAL